MNKQFFIDEVVLGWIKSDLLRMIRTIRPSSSEVGNINFPLALCILSYMESLGGFLIGKDKDFVKNVNRYLKDCFNNPEEYPVLILNDLIRNGLAHDYFPRGAISRNGKHPAIYKGQTYDVVLDVETLATDFINSLDVFVKKLTDEQYQSRMKEAKLRIKELHDKHSAFIKELSHQPDDDNRAMPSQGLDEGIDPFRQYSAKSSGASGYNGPIDFDK
jgi:hypothetical protein